MDLVEALSRACSGFFFYIVWSGCSDVSGDCHHHHGILRYSLQGLA